MEDVAADALDSKTGFFKGADLARACAWSRSEPAEGLEVKNVDSLELKEEDRAVRTTGSKTSDDGRGKGCNGVVDERVDMGDSEPSRLARRPWVNDLVDEPSSSTVPSAERPAALALLPRVRSNRPPSLR